MYMLIPLLDECLPLRKRRTNPMIRMPGTHAATFGGRRLPAKRMSVFRHRSPKRTARPIAKRRNARARAFRLRDAHPAAATFARAPHRSQKGSAGKFDVERKAREGRSSFTWGMLPTSKICRGVASRSFRGTSIDPRTLPPRGRRPTPPPRRRSRPGRCPRRSRRFPNV